MLEPAGGPHNGQFDVFLSHPHTHAEWVAEIAARLRSEGINPWLDKWELVPGEPWQQGMAKGLEEAKTCAIFIGAETPEGWLREEIEAALNKRNRDNTFRVIPVLMEGASEDAVGTFLELRTWVDFRSDPDDAFHMLVCGIKGLPPGRRSPKRADGDQGREERQLEKLAELTGSKILPPEVALPEQVKLMKKILANVD